MTYSMKPVYQKLSKIGLKKGMVKTYLPDWWEDSIATTEEGFQESLWLIANTFHIDFKTLNLSISGDSNPQYRLPNHQFKYSVNLDQDKLKPAVAVAMLAAKITLNSFEKPLADLSSLSAESIREKLLSDGNQWIDFKVLVQYCWSIGIPVIFIKEIPSPKMDGLALSQNDRPVIVLTKNDDYGVLVFHLAHELGHIILGHVEENGMMIDKKIVKDEEDDLEIQANAFALELLTGKANKKYTAGKISPKVLAESVLNKAKEESIDPLHIILNYGYSNNNFAFAKQVLQLLVKKLEIVQTDQNVAQQFFIDNIDLDSINDDEVIRRIIGAE
ncbi:ImmA/IrrE family metallo-endopeptidase [Psychrobacter sanguinis]|uniref:ImmA/IrrE family metallo-endopeptidase n=1 Tax=Psychrobacter sanguinis TaxID=861445 RepID=UPI002A74BDA8|nr:ImmA/IrrE family metallo-endopeptidase [Psychrobacter sanguinis]MDY3307594.1 ImmA/IrrE family metallo-endopeptidase [Psychrobacter sanguinis]